MTRTRVTVFMGTRPEAIKMAPVIRALRAAEDFEPIVVNTGQHREMLDHVARLFEIEIHHDLGVMRPDQKLVDLTARLLTTCGELLARIQPRIALVQGDTSTVLAASLACFYERIPVGHVEAGLRTRDRYAPFPEEMNRTLASRLCTLHFAPTELARDNLLAEGISASQICVTGNTVIDALLAEVERQQSPKVRAEIECRLARSIGASTSRPLVLITSHRRENLGRALQQICDAIAALASRFGDHDFVFPVHPNPHVCEPVRARLGGLDNVRLIEPQAYSEFVALLQRCRIVLTDSGGIQEEAPSLGKPVLVMRQITERPEAVAAGTVRLVEPDARALVEAVSRLLTDPALYDSMARASNPYGDGRAAGRILERLREQVATGR